MRERLAVWRLALGRTRRKEGSPKEGQRKEGRRKEEEGAHFVRFSFKVLASLGLIPFNRPVVG